MLFILHFPFSFSELQVSMWLAMNRQQVPANACQQMEVHVQQITLECDSSDKEQVFHCFHCLCGVMKQHTTGLIIDLPNSLNPLTPGSDQHITSPYTVEETINEN